MKLRKFPFLKPEPGEAGGGAAPAAAPAAEPAAPAAAHAASATPAATDQTAAPAGTDTSAAPAAAPAKAEPQDMQSKISDLLDKVGQPEGETTAAPGATKPAAGETKPAPAATTDGKPGTPAAPATDPKAIDLTPPEGINERGKARWTALADRAKLVPELETRATAAETQLNSVRTMVSQSGLQADEFQNMLEMGRLYKSADPKDLQAALEQLDGLRADLATRLGVDAPGVDVLADHPDLKAEVDAMTLPKSRALEIVKLRNANKTATATVQSTQEVQQFQNNVRAAAAEMDTILAQRAATPGHLAKVGHIREYFSDAARLNKFVTTYQPAQWKDAILMMYDSFQPPAAPAPVVPTAPQPLRPSHAASGTKLPGNKPVTSLQAVESAWEQAGL